MIRRYAPQYRAMNSAALRVVIKPLFSFFVCCHEVLRSATPDHSTGRPHCVAYAQNLNAHAQAIVSKISKFEKGTSDKKSQPGMWEAVRV